MSNRVIYREANVDFKEGKVTQAICAAQKAVDAVKKDNTVGTKGNSFGSYNYRSVDDVLNEVHKVFSNHNVFVLQRVLSRQVEERKTRNGAIMYHNVIEYEYKIVGEDGSYVTGTSLGEAQDSSDKAIGKTMSYSYKYFITQLLSIPFKEENKDPDSENIETEPKNPVNKKQKLTDALLAGLKRRELDSAWLEEKMGKSIKSFGEADFSAARTKLSTYDYYKQIMNLCVSKGVTIQELVEKKGVASSEWTVDTMKEIIDELK